jgi:hypothetical protein
MLMPRGATIIHMADLNDKREMELRSSAITLSDMEIFIFPELLYALVLANIMSPRVWAWKDDDWFSGADRMKPYKRITRLRQFIMDHYMFNLDLDTWGLTTKEREIGRFSEFIDVEMLKQSNALFGYEGDKYYFDIDIRTHFGLDKYEGEVIPYWKTETVEAMDAFRLRPGYTAGAGECVSLSTLYAASLFLVAGVPLKDIYLMATPLHSQNFVDLDDGILTNNRRLVTKNMWFNGTALSAQARRALENERVTMVSHETGHVHTFYDEATIDRAVYDSISSKLRSYLKAQLTPALFGTFLRQAPNVQKCFQVRWMRHGSPHYIASERVFAYEVGSPYRLTDNTREKLLGEVDSEELMHDPLAGRLVIDDLEAYIKEHQIDLDSEDDIEKFKAQFCDGCLQKGVVIEELMKFLHVQPRLPDADTKSFDVDGAAGLGIHSDMSREEIIDHLDSIKDTNRIAELAFYAWRDLSRIDPRPFVAAGIERNPVAAAELAEVSETDAAKAVMALEEASIYDGPHRLAQPDEVWNFKRGDGLEKALLLANILYARNSERGLKIHVSGRRAVLQGKGIEYEFATSKDIGDQEWLIENMGTPYSGV